ncbi:tRNA pseudouridine(55) synthase TruB [Campylobacter lanienae]|uniref:tRNA pseudouridine synthase B n=1 Tax=Campylobacter lanienae NCTC 13004 TaxID=1031753 RepID=A0A1X9SMU0_9BACT|nr:tRNA pseudouridine(55) synthase TruB [Campylobacter lanienae]ARQ97566.1 tRNA pseudouridine 55 synthase [Campylobacter lanienae NCTC 13004]MCI7363867.1 tRNA pseudouridine(55) synthase TruB [Campylobacter lanienae]MDD5786165.1 tRNA pseudouridine(55) synthase TruB [Campylobacter lanienae]
MNRLFVAYKPKGMVSNHFLSRLKRKYGVKKAGFSGILDPFASGCLIVAFGAYTRLFNYLKIEPKVYRATLWLGASSPSFDNQNITQIQNTKALDEAKIKDELNRLKGQITYTPPKFSAKKVEGKRAYELARMGREFELKECEMEIFDVKFIHYSHPFLTFEIKVSAGSYIRSYAQILSQNLGQIGTLSALERVSEGEFEFKNETPLDPLKYLNLTKNSYKGDIFDIILGKKLKATDFISSSDGEYVIEYDGAFSIIKIENQEVKYMINRMEKCLY